MSLFILLLASALIAFYRSSQPLIDAVIVSIAATATAVASLESGERWTIVFVYIPTSLAVYFCCRYIKSRSL